MNDEDRPYGEQAPMLYPGKEKRGRPRASDYVEAAAGMRVTARYSGAADDLRLADEMLAQARTKQLPSTRTEIGAGGELIDREKIGSHLVDTVAHPDYVTAEASSDRLAPQCAGLPTCRSNIAHVSRLSAGFAHASAQANGRKPARHGEAYSSAGERDTRRASGGRRRQGN